MKITAAKPKTLIVAAEDDLHAGAVIDHLRRLEMPWVRVDFGSIDRGVRLTLNMTLALSEIDTVWWRRPMAPRDLSPLDERSRAFVRAEWSLDGLSAVSTCRWVNPPFSTRRAESKPLQLRLASRCGLRIPRTAFSKDPSAVRALARSSPDLIYKRVSPITRPPTATRSVESTDFERMDDLPNCPVLFQEYIHAGADLRVTVIGSTM